MARTRVTKAMRTLERAILGAVLTDTKAAGVRIGVRKRGGVIEITLPNGRCEVCGCTDLDCSRCIARTGEPCAWANKEHTLCTACAARKRKPHTGDLRLARGGA